MTLKTIRLPQRTIIYRRHFGPYGQNNQQVMTDFKKLLASQQLLTADSTLLGVPLDDPQLTLPLNCRYDLGLVVPRTFKISSLPKTLHSRTLASGNYACFQVPHTPEGLMAIWADFPTRLKKAQLTLDFSRPPIEGYPSKLILQHQCELLVPIF